MKAFVILLIIAAAAAAYFVFTPDAPKIQELVEKLPSLPSAAPSFPEKSSWPKQVSLKETAKFSMQTKYGNVDSKLPAGTRVAVSEVHEPDTITVSTGNLTATLPIAATDFLERSKDSRGLR